MLLFKFQIRIVSSELHVIMEPGGKTDFCPSLVKGYISSPQIHAEWNKNEWDFPTYKNDIHRYMKVKTDVTCLSTYDVKLNTFYA